MFYSTSSLGTWNPLLNGMYQHMAIYLQKKTYRFITILNWLTDVVDWTHFYLRCPMHLCVPSHGQTTTIILIYNNHVPSHAITCIFSNWIPLLWVNTGDRKHILILIVIQIVMVIIIIIIIILSVGPILVWLWIGYPPNPWLTLRLPI